MNIIFWCVGGFFGALALRMLITRSIADGIRLANTPVEEKVEIPITEPTYTAEELTGADPAMRKSDTIVIGIICLFVIGGILAMGLLNT